MSAQHDLSNVIDLRLAMGRQGPDDTGEHVYVQGFDAVFRRYHAYVMTVVCRILNDRAQAEEVTQEAFISAYQHFDDLDDPSSLRSWLCTIAVRLAMKQARKARWRRRMRSLPEYETLDFIDPGATSEQRTLLAQIFAQLDALHPECKTCWVLHVVEGFTNPDVARMTGLSERTVKRRVHAAKLQLARHLEVSS